jgi:hypothetical protein
MMLDLNLLRVLNKGELVPLSQQIDITSFCVLFPDVGTEDA